MNFSKASKYYVKRSFKISSENFWMATTGEQAYRERYKRTNEQARGDIRVEGAGRAGSYISGGAEGRKAEDRQSDAS